MWISDFDFWVFLLYIGRRCSLKSKGHGQTSAVFHPFFFCGLGSIHPNRKGGIMIRIFLAVVMAAMFLAHTGVVGAETVASRAAYAAAFARAKAERKVLVIVYEDEFCGACRALKRDVQFNDLGVVVLRHNTTTDNGTLLPPGVSFAKSTDMAINCGGIQGVPRVAMLSPLGVCMGYHLGYAPGGAEAITRKIRDAKKGI